MTGAVDGRIFSWDRRAIAGQPPTARAFHSTTEVAPGRLLVYSGLGPGCCRTDVWVLDVHGMQWSQPAVGGTPRCSGGSAGHGALFFPSLHGCGGGELVLLSGASRSGHQDAHPGSVDVLEVSNQPERYGLDMDVSEEGEARAMSVGREKKVGAPMASGTRAARSSAHATCTQHARTQLR